MNSFSQYDKTTGVFTSQIYTGPRRPADTETHAWRNGIFNHIRERVDLSTDGVVQTEAPSDSAADSQRQRRRLLAQINELERKQARRVRELLAASDPRLQALDEEISALRATLGDAVVTAETDTTSPAS